MGTTSISPTSIGLSSYASDLQSVISRAVSIASMPLDQLQNQLSIYQSQSSALSSLNQTFSALQTAVQNMASAMGTGSISATSSDSSSVSVSASSQALEGSYTVNVISPGSSSSAISDVSLPAVSDPESSSISTSGSYTLTVNGNTYQITPSGSGLNDLAQAINNSPAGVQASLVNTGNSATPQYRLLLRSQSLGADSIQLNDGTTDLLDTLSTGSAASYTVEGQSTPIQSNSRSVTLAPGVTINLLQQSTNPVTVTISRNTDALSTALSSFVSTYNSAVDALQHQIGQNAGPLSGQSIIQYLTRSLGQLSTYTSSGSGLTSLADLGVELDSQGHLSFDASKLDANSVNAVQAFLGSSTGGGFLTTATNVLNSIEDSTTGSLPTAISSLDNQVQHQNNLIAENQQRIQNLQDSLQSQMASADALLAQLESQKNYITNLFTAMLNYNLNGTGVKST